MIGNGKDSGYKPRPAPSLGTGSLDALNTGEMF